LALGKELLYRLTKKTLGKSFDTQQRANHLTLSKEPNSDSECKSFDTCQLTKKTLGKSFDTCRAVGRCHADGEPFSVPPLSTRQEEGVQIFIF
jgi:hypothetical protein